MGRGQAIKFEENLSRGCGLITIPLKASFLSIQIFQIIIKVIHFVQGKNNKIHIALGEKDTKIVLHGNHPINTTNNTLVRII